MKIESLEIGRLYAYMTIIEIDDSDNDVSMIEYGKNFIGEGAIHLRKKDVDYWLVLHQVGQIYYYKLVYKS